MTRVSKVETCTAPPQQSLPEKRNERTKQNLGDCARLEQNHETRKRRETCLLVIVILKVDDHDRLANTKEQTAQSLRV